MPLLAIAVNVLPAVVPLLDIAVSSFCWAWINFDVAFCAVAVKTLQLPDVVPLLAAVLPQT